MGEELPHTIESLALFGSVARGDADRQSDIDICAFVRADSYEELVQIKRSIARAKKIPNDSVTIFNLHTLRAMCQKGSLLLWHIRLEGRILFDPNDVLKSALEDLVSFQGYEEEISIYRELLDDVKSTALENEILVQLDLHILFLVIRNVSILLTYKHGRPTFGRRSAYENAYEQYSGLPLEGQVFEDLQKWHLLYKRGIQSDSLLPDARTCKKYIGQTGLLLEFASGAVS